MSVRNMYTIFLRRTLSAFKSIPLDTKYPTTVESTVPTYQNGEQKTQINTLKSGIKVGTRAMNRPFSTIGVGISAGSRHEVAYHSGITHFLEKLAFHSSNNFPDKDAVLATLEKHCSIFDCQSTRDIMFYAISCDNRGLETITRLLVESVLYPGIREHEIEMARGIVKADIEGHIDVKGMVEQYVTGDIIHAAAYAGNTLGLPKMCPVENIPLIGRTELATFLHHHYRPENVVFAGLSVDRQQFVDCIEDAYESSVPEWADAVDVGKLVDSSKAQYVGGLVTVEKDMKKLCVGSMPLPELSHVAIGFESSSYSNFGDFATYFVLCSIFGGGGSFSAGGPGKGMFTRLYMDVMNRYHWVFNATAHNFAYRDTGLFCIYASAEPKYLGNLIEVLIGQFKNILKPIQPVELSRAKTQLKSKILMNLESQPFLLEDMIRQIIGYGHQRHHTEICAAIDAVTEEDVHVATARMLKTKPAVAVLGDNSKLPKYKNIYSYFH